MLDVSHRWLPSDNLVWWLLALFLLVALIYQWILPPGTLGRQRRWLERQLGRLILWWWRRERKRKDDDD